MCTSVCSVVSLSSILYESMATIATTNKTKQIGHLMSTNLNEN